MAVLDVHQAAAPVDVRREARSAPAPPVRDEGVERRAGLDLGQQVHRAGVARDQVVQAQGHEDDVGFEAVEPVLERELVLVRPLAGGEPAVDRPDPVVVASQVGLDEPGPVVLDRDAVAERQRIPEAEDPALTRRLRARQVVPLADPGAVDADGEAPVLEPRAVEAVVADLEPDVGAVCRCRFTGWELLPRQHDQLSGGEALGQIDGPTIHVEVFDDVGSGLWHEQAHGDLADPQGEADAQQHEHGAHHETPHGGESSARGTDCSSARRAAPQLTTIQVWPSLPVLLVAAAASKPRPSYAAHGSGRRSRPA